MFSGVLSLPAAPAALSPRLGAPSARQSLPSLRTPKAPGLRSRRCRVAARAALPGIEYLASNATHFLTIATTADPAITEVVQSAARKTGPLTPLANAMEGVLQALDGVLEGAHVPYSYGFSIILLTVMVKAATFPLTKKQMDSTNAVQALAPRVKELQQRYKNDQERLQLETARLYKEAGVNPLAGCLPTLATIPVFIGLYRALSNAADDGLLTDGFFWIPSLGGPTSLAARDAGTGNKWLFPFVDGHPPIGWHDAGAYLVLPVLLVCSQFISQRIMQPNTKTDDPAQQQTQAILKFLPLMIGWFSLNVPSGLTLYWFTNNILTTAQSVYLRSRKSPVVEAMVNDIPMGATTVVNTSKGQETEKKPKGKDTGARRKKGDKFKQLKAAEAATRAAKASELAEVEIPEAAESKQQE